MKITIAIIYTALILGISGNFVYADSNEKDFQIDYVKDQTKFKVYKVDILTSDEEIVIQKSIDYLSDKYGAKIDGVFSIAESKSGYQVNFWKLKIVSTDGEEIEIKEGFGELFFDDSLELIDVAIGP